MTTMDTTNPLAALPDGDLLAYRRVRDHVRGGRPLAELPDADLLAYRRVRDAASGKAAPAAPSPTLSADGYDPSFTPASFPRPDLSPQLIHDIAHAQRPTPAAPVGYQPGREALGITDVPVMGPVVRMTRALTDTPEEALARQYAAPQVSGVGGLATRVARMGAGVLDPGGASIASAANTLEQGGGPIQAAASGGISAALNVARMPFLDPLERAGAGLVAREAPAVVRRAAGLAARGVGAGVGFGEAQAAAEGVANLPRSVGQAAEAGDAHPVKAAIADEFNRLVAAQPEILTSGSLGGVVAEFAMRAAGRGFNRLAGDNTGPRPGGAAESAGSTLPPGDAIPQAAPRPDQARARAAEAVPDPTNEPTPPARQPAAASDTNPAAMELPREVPQEGRPQGRQGLLTQPAPTPPGESAPGDGGASTPNAVGGPIRSTDTLAPGETVTDAKGQRFTVGPTLESGKVVVRREDGKAVRLTAGEMEARGWSKVHEGVPQVHEGVPQVHEGVQGEPPARIDAGEPSSLPDGVPAVGGQEKSTPESGRVGPPPETVANPPGLPKGEKQPWEMSQEEFGKHHVEQANDHAKAQRKADLAAKLWGESDPRTVALRAEADRLRPVSDIVTIARRDAVQRAMHAGHDVPRHVLDDLKLPRPKKSRTATPEVAGANRPESPDSSRRPEKSQPATPEVAPPEPNQPGFWKSLRDRAQQRINERAAAQREAEAQYRGTGARRGSAGSLDPRTLADRAVILASHIAEAGMSGAKAIKAKALELFGEPSPEVVRAAYRMLRSGQGPDGKVDPARLEMAAHDALTEAQAKARTAPNESADVREMMAKRDAEAKAEVRMSAAGEKAKAERQAMREDFADQLDTLKAKGAVGQDIREALADAARRYLDPSDLPKVLKFIAKAKALESRTVKRPDGTTTTEPVSRQWYDGLRKILDIADQSSAKKARAALLGTVGGPERPKSSPKLASAINQRIGILPEKTELSRGVIEPDKLLPKNRDAVADLVKAIKKGFTRRDLTEKLADHLEELAGRLGSGWADDATIAELRGIGTKPTKDLTEKEATVLREGLQHLEHLNKVERTAVVGGKEVDRQKLHEDIRSQVESRFPKDMTPDKEVGPIRLILRQIRRGVGESFRGFGHLTGTAFGEDSAAHDLLYRNAHRAESKQLASAEDAKDAIRKTAIANKVDNAELTRMRTQKETISLPGGSKIEMTPADRMLLVARYSDPQNRELMLANGVKHERYDGVKGHTDILAPADYEAIEASMSPAERAIVAEFKKQTNGRLRKEMNEASVRIDGYEIATNPDHVSRAVDSYGRERNRKDQTFTLRRWLEDMGILKERTKHKRAILYGDFFAFADKHIDQMTRYAHMAEPIRDALIAIGDPETRSLLIRKFGRQFITNIEDHYQYVSGTAGKAASPEDNVLRRWTGAGATAILAARPTSAALQNVGFLAASVDAANAGEAARIARHVADVRWADDAAYEDMIAHSGALRVRHEHGATRLIDFTRGEQAAGIGSRVTDGAISTALHPLSARDRFVSVTVFKEVRETVRAEHPDWTPDQVNEEAAIRTEQNVGRTQNPSQRMDRSRADRDSDTNALKAAWLMFTSAGVRTGNLIQSKLYEAYKNPSPETKARAAWAVGSAVVSAAVAEAIREAWRKAKHGFQDEKYPRDAGDHGTNITSDLANNFLPGSGDVVRGVVAKLRGKPIFKDNGGMTESAVAAFGKLADLGEYLLTPGDTQEGQDRKERALKRLAESGSVLAPLDVVRGVKAAITGPEPAGWSIAAALKRNDYKTALERAKKLAALKLQRTKEDGEPVEPETVQRGIAASIAAYLNKGLKKGQDDDAMADNASTARDLASDAMP